MHRAYLLTILAVLLTSCGVASPDGVSLEPGSKTAAALQITTSRLPDGNADGEYPPTQLVAVGAQGPLDWHLAAGELPPGVTLSAGGIVSGAPNDEGLYPFSVTVTDGIGSDERDLVLAIDTFGVGVGGMHFGEAWAEEPLTLDAVGSSGACTFEIVGNESGGGLDRVVEGEGHAVWLPGPTVAPCTDVLRVTDAETGASVEVVIDVLPHPAPHVRAEFGGTDVWYVDVGHRFGDHGLPRDWDEALRVAGLRSAEVVPTLTDRLTDWYVRRAMLCELGRSFGRNADGSIGDGLPISFPMDRPPAPYAAPAPGSWASAAPGRYNVIGVLHGSSASVLGMAFQDGPTNGLAENDSTSAAYGEMGVFVNRVVHSYNAAFQNNTLPASPVGLRDEMILRALIHGQPVEGDRVHLIRRAADGVARAVATVLAHEIGHSLGLGHTNPIVAGSLMNGGTAHYPGAEYAFLPGDMAGLRASLPGPGRFEGDDVAKPGTLPAGGIAACEHPAAPRRCGCAGGGRED